MRVQLLLVITLLIFGCKSGEVKMNTVVTKGYELRSADDKKGAGTLAYIITEEYQGDKLLKKVHMDKYERITGIEKYTYKSGSNPNEIRYYDGNDKLLSSYKLTFDGKQKVSAEGYAGDFEELLRVEKFKYNNKGHRIRKEIYDAAGKLQSYHTFVVDSLGNDIKFENRDAASNKVFLKEDYEIVEKDLKGKWLRKWGYRNGSAFPTSLQEKSESL